MSIVIGNTESLRSEDEYEDEDDNVFPRLITDHLPSSFDFGGQAVYWQLILATDHCLLPTAYCPYGVYHIGDV